MWTKDIINDYGVWTKHYDEGSEYGIKGGRISKLTIRKDGRELLNYDRGWDIKPDKPDKARMEAYNIVLKQYN